MEMINIKINGVASLLGFRLLFYLFISPNAPLFSPSPSFTRFSLLLHCSHQTKTLYLYSKRERKRTTKLPKMLLGKRPRPPMKRTTSMSEITLDLNTAASDAPDQRRSGASGGAGGGGLTPKILRRHSSDFVDTPHFLRACALCKGRLAPGRDIYMYRGDSAFCSLECRQHQMNQDERREKFVTASKKQVMAPPPSGSQILATTKGETTVVAL